MARIAAQSVNHVAADAATVAESLEQLNSQAPAEQRLVWNAARTRAEVTVADPVRGTSTLAIDLTPAAGRPGHTTVTVNIAFESDSLPEAYAALATQGLRRGAVQLGATIATVAETLAASRATPDAPEPEGREVA